MNVRKAPTAVVFVLLSLSVTSAENRPGSTFRLAVPPQAAAAGFNKLVFYEDFTSLDLSTSNQEKRRWWTRVWWNKAVEPSKHSYSLIKGGGVRIATTGPSVSLYNHPDDAQPYGANYIFGYFEARMRFAGRSVTNNWGAFWLFSKKAIERMVSDARGAQHWCEIDVVEVGGHNLIGTTVHSWRWPLGGNMEDTHNSNNVNKITIDPIDGKWHIFGLVWKKDFIAWFIDGQLIATHGSYPICNQQPMTLVVSAQSHANDAQETDVEWIRVWQ